MDGCYQSVHFVLIVVNIVSAFYIHSCWQGWRQEFPDEGARFPEGGANDPSVEGASRLGGFGGMLPRENFEI